VVNLSAVTGGPVLIRPTVGGIFVDGTWMGSITALAPATNLVLRANDESGHTGDSAPIQVTLRNDLALTVTDLPDPVALGGDIHYLITVTNIGPSAATGVWLTNSLPASGVLVVVTNSQGICFSNGNVLVCELGALAADASAFVEMDVRTTSAEMVTNQATVYRAEADTYAANNYVVTVTWVASVFPSPLRFQMPGTAGDGLQLVLGTLDGSPIAPGRAARVQLFSTTDHSLTPSNWTLVNVAPVLTNGVLQFEGPSQTNSAFRFFRAEETP
jgi:uncharacterized repeat protein (TIGR01451 family)